MPGAMGHIEGARVTNVKLFLDRTLLGLLLIALGVMFLLDTTNAFGGDTDIFGTYWPVLLIAWGLWGMVASGLRLRLGSMIVLAVGVVFLLSNLGVWAWNVGQLWPIILVVIGLVLVAKWGIPGSRRRARVAKERYWYSREADPNGSWGGSYVFGGGQERITSPDFKGGHLSAIFGGVELDLREASLAGGKATIDATVVCGGIEITVPKDWLVSIQTSTILGGTENKHQQPDPEEAKAELTITGTVVCGGIEVKN